jgi:hypothetical protein
MALVQDFIHFLEGARGTRFSRYALLALAVVCIGVAYNVRAFRNFSTAEAMDAAQLARNLAEGRGYSTLCIRPLSIYLVKRTEQKKHGGPTPGKIADQAHLRGPHPDLANPPVYPVLLAGWMRVMPFNHTAMATKPFWGSHGHFWRYQPDFLIALLNELLLLAVIAAAAWWARRLFDSAVAWTAAGVLLGTELLWRFSTSGLSTMLLLLIFMGLVWCLTLLEAEAREPRWRPSMLPVLAATAGVLLGMGTLTRYSFGWLVLPVLTFLVLFSGTRWRTLAPITLAAFALVLAPWIVRNYQVSGTPFGTATFALLEGTSLYPEFRLERSLSPHLQFPLSPILSKLFANTRSTLPTLFSGLGGGWIGGFFLVGLLVAFRNPALRRMRYFTLMSLAVLLVVQALGRTQLSEDSPEVNSENLLVLLLPLIVIFGIGLFFVLLDQITFPVNSLRYGVIGLFGALAWLPMALALLPPRAVPVVYPPYHPLVIQQTAAWMKQDELMMSDIPWAVAWYGNRQCVWLTLNATSDPNNPDSPENFFSINDFLKPINALYLTPRTLDSRFVSGWIRAGDFSWGDFVVNTLLKSEVPPEFPLRQMPSGYLPEQLFLSDWKRWR